MARGRFAVAVLLLLTLLGAAGAMGLTATVARAADPPPASAKPKPHPDGSAHASAGANAPAPKPRVIGSRVDTSLAYPVTVTTDTANDANCQPAGMGDCTLRQAINAASTHDPGTGVNRITFAANVTGAIILNAAFGPLIVSTYPVQITGPGQAVLAIDGGCTAGCGTATPTGGVAVLQTDLATAPALTLSDLTIRNGAFTPSGSPSYSAGLTTYGPVTLTNVTVSGNSTLGTRGYGGGLLATYHGGPNGPIATLTNVTATGNYADNFAGGIEIDDLGQLPDGTGTLTNLVVTGNTSGRDAGGIALENVGTVTGLTVTGNTAISYAGGIETDDVLTITNATVTNNHVTANTGDGGGLVSDWLLTLTNATITGNTAGEDGGGFYNDDDCICTNVTITNNTAGRDGGGYYGDSYRRNNRLLNNFTITGNTAGGDGGGYYDAFVSIVVNSTITHNTATGSGGGVYIVGSGGSAPLLARDPRIIANATFTLDSSTVSDNTANIGGGIGLGTVGRTPAVAALNDTIVAGNHLAGTAPVGPDLANSVGDTYNGTYNLIGDGTGQSGTALVDGTNNNRVGTTAAPLLPLLAPLGTYGATNGIQTFALLPGSPAIDTGTCPMYTVKPLQVTLTTTTATVTVTTDARGIARPQGSACDVGAFESRGFTLTNPTGGGQSVAITQPFAAPLGIAFTPGDPGVPVDGGIVTFTLAPVGGTVAAFAATGGSGAGCTVSNGGLTAVCPISGGIATTPTITTGTVPGSVGASAGASVTGAPTTFTPLTVTQATTTTTVTAAPNPTTVTTSVTLTATVTGAATGVVPGGTVTFTLGGTTLGTGTLNGSGVATASTTAIPLGTNQTITATYAGDTRFTGSAGTTTITVSTATLTLTAATGSGSGNGGTATMPVVRVGASTPLFTQLNGMPLAGVTYTSSNPNVVSVDPVTGVVTGISGGTATITASGPNGATGTIVVTITSGTGSGLMNPNPQPNARPNATAAPNAMPAPQPITHPTTGGGAQPQSVGQPTATPLAQPASH